MSRGKSQEVITDWAVKHGWTVLRDLHNEFHGIAEYGLAGHRVTVSFTSHGNVRECSTAHMRLMHPNRVAVIEHMEDITDKVQGERDAAVSP